MSALTLEERLDRAPAPVKRQVSCLLEASEADQETLDTLLSEISQGTPRGEFLARLLRLGVEMSEPISHWPNFAQQDDWQAVVEVLTQPGVIEKTLPQADPLAVHRLKGIATKQKLLSDQGQPPLTSEQVAQRLGMSREAVNKRRRNQKLVAVSFGKRGYRYPAWQFQDRQVVPGLDQVLQALEQAGEWTPLQFLCSGDPHLDGDTPLERMKQGDLEAAIAAARCYGKANPS